MRFRLLDVQRFNVCTKIRYGGERFYIYILGNSAILQDMLYRLCV